MQRMSDDRKTVCEECEGALERIISQSAFHLKGGGWYKDLYSSTKKEGDSKESSSGKEGASGNESSSSDAAKSDTSAKSTGDASTKPKTSSDTPAKPKPAKAKASSKE